MEMTSLTPPSPPAQSDHTKIKRPPVFLDAVQLSAQLYSEQLIGHQGHKESRLKADMDPLIFPNARIKINKSGYVSVGDRFGYHRILSTCGARIIRAKLNSQMPQARTANELKALGNQLTLEEKAALEALMPGEAPWDYSVQQLINVIPDVLNEAMEHVSNNHTIMVPMQAAPVVIRRLQFYREYATTDKSLPNIMDQLAQAAAPSFGACESRVHYNKQWKDTGALRRWKLQIRGESGQRKKRTEGATLTAYYKGGMLRIEVSRELPRHPLVMPNEKSKLHTIFAGFAEQAIEVLDRVDDQLKISAPEIPVDHLYNILKKYGVRAPQKNVGWIGFVDQVARTKVFDHSQARLEGNNLPYSMLSQRLAHPEWGILSKQHRIAINGTSNKFVFLLRHDWQEQAANLDIRNMFRRKHTGSHAQSAAHHPINPEKFSEQGTNLT